MRMILAIVGALNPLPTVNTIRRLKRVSVMTLAMNWPKRRKTTRQGHWTAKAGSEAQGIAKEHCGEVSRTQKTWMDFLYPLPMCQMKVPTSPLGRDFSL
jgi:hypothetical protein